MIDRNGAAVGAAGRYARRFFCAGSVLAALAATPAYAQKTQAGTEIRNTATATYGPAEDESTVNSNEVLLVVDELLDVTVTWDDPADVTVEPEDTGRMLTYTVTNAGNGSEAFALTAVNGAGDDMDPTVTSIVLDSNDNDIYDALTDTVYAVGTNDPVLPADGSIKVFIFSTIPADAADGDRGRIDLRAVSKTRATVTGTVVAGDVVEDAGEGEGDAVIGSTLASAEDDGYYVADVEVVTPPDAPIVTLVKDATVVDPFGGSTNVPGSIITYELVATVSGTGSATNLRVGDEIPTGTTYVTSSIKLDGDALTDADDTDAGQKTAAGVEVELGTVASGDSRTVTFAVKIDDGDDE